MPVPFTPWPLSLVRIAVAGLELRLPSDDELGELAVMLADERLPVPPLANPHDTPPERAWRFMQEHWRARAEWSPQSWCLDLFAFDGGRPVGMQRILARHYAVVREVLTGSVVVPSRRGTGVGTAMRAAALQFAFAELGAESAVTSTAADNAASLAVTAKFGYEPDGVSRVEEFGSLLILRNFRLSAARWRGAGHRHDVVVSGLDGQHALFGVDAVTG